MATRFRPMETQYAHKRVLEALRNALAEVQHDLLHDLAEYREFNKRGDARITRETERYIQRMATLKHINNAVGIFRAEITESILNYIYYEQRDEIQERWDERPIIISNSAWRSARGRWAPKSGGAPYQRASAR